MLKNYLTLKNKLHDIIITSNIPTLLVNEKENFNLLKLKNNQLISLIDQTAINYNNFTKISYIIETLKERIIFLTIPSKNTTRSIQSIFKSAIITERETYEFFGILFKGAYDLRRLLTDYGMIGFPLKKSYPLPGFSMVSWSMTKTIIHKPIILAQELRLFTFNFSWIN